VHAGVRQLIERQDWSSLKTFVLGHLTDHHCIWGETLDGANLARLLCSGRHIYFPTEIRQSTTSHPSLAVEPVGLDVTTTATSLDVDASKLPGRGDRAVSHEDVVRLGVGQDIAVDIVHEDVGNVHTVGGLSSWSAVY
jgi:hypothetical protein